MTGPEKAVARLKELQVAAKSVGVDADVAALYAHNVAKRLKLIVCQEFEMDKSMLLMRLRKCFYYENGRCSICQDQNAMKHSTFPVDPAFDREWRRACRYVMRDGRTWPWQGIDSVTKKRVECYMRILMWYRYKHSYCEDGRAISFKDWHDWIIRDFDEVCIAACDTVGRKLAKEAGVAADGGVAPPPSVVDSILKRIFQKLSMISKKIGRKRVPTEAQRDGEVSRMQVQHGVSLYRPSSRHRQGVSFREAAKKAINDPKFKDRQGAYRIRQIDTLAQAIRREYHKRRADSAT